jgi:hypothetical protein
MKAVVVHGIGDIRFDDVREPTRVRHDLLEPWADLRGAQRFLSVTGLATLPRVLRTNVMPVANLRAFRVRAAGSKKRSPALQDGVPRSAHGIQVR